MSKEINFLKWVNGLIFSDKIKVGQKVRIVCEFKQGELGTVTYIMDNGDYRNITVEYMDRYGITRDDCFHDGDLIPANLN